MSRRNFIAFLLINFSLFANLVMAAKEIDEKIPPTLPPPPPPPPTKPTAIFPILNEFEFAPRYCAYNGNGYRHGSLVYYGPFDDETYSCPAYYCRNGLILHWITIRCRGPPNKFCNPIFITGECCPKWDCPLEDDIAVDRKDPVLLPPKGCLYKGEFYEEGEEIYMGPFNDDKCIVYGCRNGDVVPLVTIFCEPASDYPGCTPLFSKDICCPQYSCPGEGAIIDDFVPGPPFCVYKGNVYANGAFVYYGPYNQQHNACPAHYCINGKIIHFKSILCPEIPPNCIVIPFKGLCCPVLICPVVQPPKVKKCVALP